jgi:hypothetical protein
MRLAKDAVKKQASRNIPSVYNLRELYQFVTGKDLDNPHRALSDVKATVLVVLCHEAFWMHCQDNVFQFAFEEGGPAVPELTGQEDNSPVDDDDDNSSVSSSSSSEEETGDSTALGNRWENGVDFIPSIPTPQEKFHELHSLNS